MGITESALLLLGVGIISEQFGGGVGLEKLGIGISTLAASPMTGMGTGLSSLAGGITSISESFGDLGRGLSDLFSNIPSYVPPHIPEQFQKSDQNGKLITLGGGGSSALQTGGGGNVRLGYRANGLISKMPYRTYALPGESRTQFRARRETLKVYRDPISPSSDGGLNL